MKSGAILSKYFNTAGDPEGYQKKTSGEFVKELRALDKDERRELATLAADELGLELEEG